MQAWLLGLIVSCFVAGYASKALGQKKRWFTHWGFSYNPKPKDPLDFDPATHLPPDHERFVWQLSLPKEAMPESSIPTFQFDLLKSEFVPAGSRERGPFIEIKALRRFNYIHYYLVSVKGETQSFWIAGHYLKAVDKLPASASQN